MRLTSLKNCKPNPRENQALSKSRNHQGPRSNEIKLKGRGLAHAASQEAFTRTYEGTCKMCKPAATAYHSRAHVRASVLRGHVQKKAHVRATQRRRASDELIRKEYWCIVCPDPCIVHDTQQATYMNEFFQIYAQQRKARSVMFFWLDLCEDADSCTTARDDLDKSVCNGVW